MKKVYDRVYEEKLWKVLDECGMKEYLVRGKGEGRGEWTKTEG